MTLNRPVRKPIAMTASQTLAALKAMRERLSHDMMMAQYLAEFRR